MSRRIPHGAGPDSLTFRERQILASYMPEPNAKIAAAGLGISYQTFKNHVTTILDKLGVERFGQAVVLYERSVRERDAEAPERRWRERRQGDRRNQQAGPGVASTQVFAPDPPALPGSRREREDAHFAGPEWQALAGRTG